MSNVQSISDSNNVSNDADNSGHTVQSGETFSTLSQRYNVSSSALQKANPQVTNPGDLSPGQVINIPTNSGSVAAQSRPTTTSLFDGTRASYTPVFAKSESKLNQRTTNTEQTKGKFGATDSGVHVGVGTQSSAQTTTTTPYGSSTNSSNTSQGLKLGSEKNGLSIGVNKSVGFQGEFKNDKGYGVSYEVGGNASVSSKQSTDKGVTTYTSSVDVSVHVKFGASLPQGGFKQGTTEGAKAEFEVSLPEDVASSTKLENINPFEPDALPVGTSIRLDGSRYTTNEFSATFKNLSLQTRVTDEAGVSVAIEKTTANKVTVTAGPTEAIKAYNGIGLGVGSVSASVGVSDSLGESTLKTATYDINTPQGRAAYNDFLSTGQIPSSSGPGVSGIRTTEHLSVDSTLKGGIKVGQFDLSKEINSNTGTVVRVIEEDGSFTRTATLQYGDNAPLTLNQSFDTTGKEQLESRVFSFEVVLDKTTASVINNDFTTGTDTEFAPGQTVSISLSPSQAQKFFDQYKSVAKNYPTSTMTTLNRDQLTPELLLTGLAGSTLGSDHSLVVTLFKATQLTSPDLSNPVPFDAMITRK